jgi:hypothetical protein
VVGSPAKIDEDLKGTLIQKLRNAREMKSPTLIGTMAEKMAQSHKPKTVNKQLALDFPRLSAQLSGVRTAPKRS